MPKNKLNCPNCGSDQYVVNHAGGSTSTFLLCKQCGKKGTPEAWKKMKSSGDSFETKAFNFSKLKKKDIKASSVADNNQLASDKPSEENDPELAFKRKKAQERRNREDVDRICDHRYDA